MEYLATMTTQVPKGMPTEATSLSQPRATRPQATERG
jgi:muconolactone delta-isomerase